MEGGSAADAGDGAAAGGAGETLDEDEEARRNGKKSKRTNRLSVAELKRVVDRPDVVELHDANAADPKLLVHLKVRHSGADVGHGTQIEGLSVPHATLRGSHICSPSNFGTGNAQYRPCPPALEQQAQVPAGQAWH